MNCTSVIRIFLWLALLASVRPVLAQQRDTSDKMTIHILNNRVLTFIKTDSGEFFHFVGDVIMQQGTDTLYCDSLYQNKTTNILEAFGNVRVAQEGGTQGTCAYLRYTSARKLAQMKGNVHLTDGKNELWCDDLAYDLATKVGVYTNGGTLHADSTTVTSNTGVYNVKSKEARFTGQVTITDKDYITSSKDLGYNTETKETRFYAASTVVGDSGKTRLETSAGVYDSQKGIALLTTPSKIWYDGEYIEGDTLYYNRPTGYGYGKGHVIAWDTANKITLYCGNTEYYRRKRIFIATGKPVLQQVKGRDTLYLRADTFYAAPIFRNVRGKDSIGPKLLFNGQPPTGTALLAEPMQGKKNSKKQPTAVQAPPMDTTWADSTAPLYFAGYHHVKIFSDSLQGVCDSVVYTQSDSTVRMIYDPVAWSRNGQITGDTICLQLDSNRLKSIYVPNNAFVVSLSGPEQAGLYDQVQGRTLRGYLKNNEMTSMVVFPNSEVIYYSKDSSGAFIGLSQSKSERMHIYFEHQNISAIKFEQDVHQSLTPMDKADLPNARLSRFKWLADRRPKSKNEIFD